MGSEMCIRDRGKENARRFLKDNPELAEEIQYKTLVKLGIIEDGEEAPEGIVPEGALDDTIDPLEDLPENF